MSPYVLISYTYIYNGCTEVYMPVGINKKKFIYFFFFMYNVE